MRHRNRQGAASNFLNQDYSSSANGGPRRQGRGMGRRQGPGGSQRGMQSSASIGALPTGEHRQRQHNRGKWCRYWQACQAAPMPSAQSADAEVQDQPGNA